MNVPVNANLATAQAFADKLKSENPRRTSAIDHIWHAALTLIEKEQPITKEGVGRLAHSAGGPNGHSIRKQKDYGHLVELLAEVKPKRSSRKAQNDLQILNALGNEVDRSRIRQVIQERDRLREKLAWLKKAVPLAVNVDDETISSLIPPALPKPQQSTILSPDERHELGKLLSEGFWFETDAELRETGVYVEGIKVLDGLAIKALRRIIAPE